MSKRDRRIDAALTGWVVAFAGSFIAMPICVFAGVEPAVWGCSAIVAMPVGAALGYVWAATREASK